MNRKSLTAVFALATGITAVVLLLAGMTLARSVEIVLAQADMPALNTPYTQNFDTLEAVTGTYPFTNNLTIEGWYSNRTDYGANNGTSHTGALYSFGSAGSSDRALGSIASGTTGEIRYGVRLKNTTGVTITALDIAYTGEQWRQGGNNAQQALAFTYQISPTFYNITDGIWIDFPALYFWSPITNSGAITGALDGNNPANRRELSATLNVMIPPGHEIVLRWVDINDAGSDHGLAIDDLSVIPYSAPFLHISKEVTPTTEVDYNGTVTYTVVLENIGGVDDAAVLFTDTLPAEVDFGEWIEQPDGATVSNDEITWSGTLTAGTAITFAFTAQHVGNYGDVVTNTADFSGTEETGSAQAVFTVETLTKDVTFVYHDLEDVVQSGEAVYLAGDFNGWSTTATPMTSNDDHSVFTATVPGLNVGQTYQYKYYVNSSALSGDSRWDMLNTSNRALTVTSGLATVDDYRNVVVGWAILQWPPTLQTDINTPTDLVYGQVYIQNVTNPSGEGRGIRAEVGYGNSPNPADWTWLPMVYNVDNGNNDEFMGTMTPTVGGVFSYAVRFDGNWGPGNPNAGWTYGDINEAPPFELDQTGVLTSVVYDVAVTKTVQVPYAIVRDGESAPVTYTLTVENRSTISSTGAITLTDVLPENFVYVGDDSGVTSTGDGSAGDPLTWVFTNPLPSGASLSFNLIVSATDALTATGLYTNTAAVAVEGGDWVSENDTVQAGVTVYRVIPIGQARGLPLGTLATVEGTVTAEPGIFQDGGQSRKLYMQDATGGILVYLAAGLNPVDRYNRIRATGIITEYRSETELIPSNASAVVDLGSDMPVTPLALATGDVNEDVEGQLVRVAGYIVEKPNDDTLRVNDGSGNVDIYRYYNLGQTGDPNYIDFTPYMVGDYVVVTGTTRGYDYSGTVRREILPRGPADIQELYPTTFIYHDLEDVVQSGEAVYLAGDFNGWSTTATPMTANDDYSVFSVTVTLTSTGTDEYKYIVYTDTVPSGPANWNWLQSQNRSVEVTAPGTVNDYRDIRPGYMVLQWPHAVTTTVGIPTENIYGRIWADDLTSREGPPRAVLAQVGYGTDPDPANWTTWSPMVWNTQSDNNDEFMGGLTPTAVGVYSYVVRFNGNWGTGNPNNQWYYGDTDGVYPGDPFEIEKAGVLTVLAPSLTLTKAVLPQTGVPLGGVVVYTVTLSNGGEGLAGGIVLTDALPAEVAFGGWVQGSGAVHESGVITWTGDLAGGVSVTLVFTATVGTDPSLYNRTVTNTAAYRSDNAGSGSAEAAFTTERRYYIYMPLVMKNYRP